MGPLTTVGVCPQYCTYSITQLSSCLFVWRPKSARMCALVAELRAPGGTSTLRAFMSPSTHHDLAHAWNEHHGRSCGVPPAPRGTSGEASSESIRGHELERRRPPGCWSIGSASASSARASLMPCVPKRRPVVRSTSGVAAIVWGAHAVAAEALRFHCVSVMGAAAGCAAAKLNHCARRTCGVTGDWRWSAGLWACCCCGD